MRTVYEVMRHINNFFERGYRATEYTITGGALEPADLLRPGLWVCITGSFYHDGAWRIDADLRLEDLPENTPDETFTGRVWLLAPPPAFLALCDEIAEFVQKNSVTPYQSESFGEYSYTKAQGKGGGILSWQEAFADRLQPYRHMFTEVL